MGAPVALAARWPAAAVEVWAPTVLAARRSAVEVGCRPGLIGQPQGWLGAGQVRVGTTTVVATVLAASLLLS
jgi:hypothetical protein